MSIQISPWSTHEQNFKMDVKKKFVRLSPINKAHRKKGDTNKQQLKSRLEISNLGSITIAATVENEEETAFIDGDSREEHIELELRREKQRNEQLIEENALIKLIHEKLKLEDNVPFMFPTLKLKKRQPSISKIKHLDIENKTIALGPPKPKQDLKPRKTKQGTPSDHKSRVKVLNVNPFDDKDILERGLAVLKASRNRARNNIGTLSMRIKGT